MRSPLFDYMMETAGAGETLTAQILQVVKIGCHHFGPQR